MTLHFQYCFHLVVAALFGGILSHIMYTTNDHTIKGILQRTHRELPEDISQMSNMVNTVNTRPAQQSSSNAEFNKTCPPEFKKSYYNPQQQTRRQKQQVLLVSYGRCGTMYTSALISHNPEVFYTPEPLHRKSPSPPVTSGKHANDVVRGFLECSPFDVDAGSYGNDNLQVRVSQVNYSLIYC